MKGLCGWMGSCAIPRWMLVLFLVIGIGCAGTQRAPEEAAEETTKAEGPGPRYYDFDDILVPSQLSLDKRKSFVYRTSSFSAGVLVFDGYVEGASVANFFTANMAEDGWTLKSSFRYRRIILTFEKGQRSCLINISESTLKTKVEIWVAPQATSAGL